jgi:hypothetical protein
VSFVVFCTELVLCHSVRCPVRAIRLSQGPGDPFYHVTRIPGLKPGTDSVLQVGDHTVCDALIEVGLHLSLLVLRLRAAATGLGPRR